MKMEIHENSCDSLPYIDDSPADEDTTPHQYNLKISENYQNKNRNIEITNRLPIDIARYLGPAAPPSEENELNDLRQETDRETQKEMKNLAASGVKLIIKGWHSNISIQGLDNKSFITFKRRCDKLHKKENQDDETMTKTCGDESKPKRGRWKMLTKSLMLARSARFERRGLDERYPKYVLLKNDDEEMKKAKENYPKMFVFNERRKKGNAGFKNEFNLKKSFKNKTEPIVPLDKILNNAEEDRNRKPKQIPKVIQNQPLTERSDRSENKNFMIKKRIVVERKQSLKPDEHSCSESGGFPLPQGFVCSEIQGIFEDTLKLLPQSFDIQQDKTREPENDMDCCSSLPPQYCHQFSCHDPHCCLRASGQTPKYVPVYPPPGDTYKSTNTQTESNPPEEQCIVKGDLPFGLLSSFFPRVVIMKAIQGEHLREENKTEMISSSTHGLKSDPESREEVKDPQTQEEVSEKVFQNLQIPPQDLTLKSKMVQKSTEYNIKDSVLNDDGLKESSSSDEELKTKTQESEATTEYFQYSEFPDSSGNEAVDKHDSKASLLRYDSKEEKPQTTPAFENGDENLTLTKIGYKMYDNLTKLSLNREKEIMKTTEAGGCGCNTNETKKSPCNITFESNNRVVKVTVPENELNFQIVNSQGADIQIGVTSSERGNANNGKLDQQEKTLVRKEELWHSDDGGSGRTLVLKNENLQEAAFQKLKLSFVDNKDVVLSIEMNERDKKEEKTKEKRTKEMKVGTDDFDLAGGDFVFSGGNHKNLSPRIGRLLKHLHEKLESDERERKFLDEKINQKLLEHEGVLPGVFLVKHISPRNQIARKPSEVPALVKTKKVTNKEEKEKQLREYYCEECLATMRIFEDENPSVKSMVDKFETIIQLESF